MTKVLAAVHPSEVGRRKAAQLARQVIDFETAVSAVLPEIDDLSDVTVGHFTARPSLPKLTRRRNTTTSCL